MGEGRGSAVVGAVVMALAVVMVIVVGCADVAEAATAYKVGGVSGWTFNMVAWPRGKRFKAGDTLVFKYNPRAHNVVAVNKAAYNSCKPSAGAKVYRSGNDRIKLAKGPNYFLCSLPGHCQSGMKIAVTAV